MWWLCSYADGTLANGCELYLKKPGRKWHGCQTQIGCAWQGTMCFIFGSNFWNDFGVPCCDEESKLEVRNQWLLAKLVSCQLAGSCDRHDRNYTMPDMKFHLQSWYNRQIHNDSTMIGPIGHFYCPLTSLHKLTPSFASIKPELFVGQLFYPDRSAPTVFWDEMSWSVTLVCGCLALDLRMREDVHETDEIDAMEVLKGLKKDVLLRRLCEIQGIF